MFKSRNFGQYTIFISHFSGLRLKHVLCSEQQSTVSGDVTFLTTKKERSSLFDNALNSFI